jgi:hypothetical protein
MLKERILLLFLLTLGFLLHRQVPLDTPPLLFQVLFTFSVVSLIVRTVHLVQFFSLHSHLLELPPKERLERIFLSLLWILGALSLIFLPSVRKSFDQETIFAGAILGIMWLLKLKPGILFCLSAALLFSVPTFLLYSYGRTAERFSVLVFLLLILAIFFSFTQSDSSSKRKLSV